MARTRGLSQRLRLLDGDRVQASFNFPPLACCHDCLRPPEGSLCAMSLHHVLSPVRSRLRIDRHREGLLLVGCLHDSSTEVCRGRYVARCLWGACRSRPICSDRHRRLVLRCTSRGNLNLWVISEVTHRHRLKYLVVAHRNCRRSVRHIRSRARAPTLAVVDRPPARHAWS